MPGEVNKSKQAKLFNKLSGFWSSFFVSSSYSN